MTPTALTTDLLPTLGVGEGLALLVVAALAGSIAHITQRLRAELAPKGLLPSVLTTINRLVRGVVVLALVGALFSVLPRVAQQLVPLVLLAMAVAIGWSSRDILQDLVAWIALAIERRLKPGLWISTSTASGTIQSMSLRVTWVRDASGRSIAIPNRMLMHHPVITQRSTWPMVEAVVQVPGNSPQQQVRKALEEAVLVSPWAAPLPPERIIQESGQWRVRAHVLESRFAYDFEKGLASRVTKLLQTPPAHTPASTSRA